MSPDCPGESSPEKECYWKHSLMFQQPDSDDNFGPMPLSPGQLDYIVCTNYYMWGHTSSYIIFSLHTFSIFFSCN